MSCPTCDHMMQSVAHDAPNEWTLFWCPRCGTLRWGEDDPPDVPKLVERCREFAREAWHHELAAVATRFLTRWRRLGIAESIRTTAERGLDEKAGGT